MKLLNCASVLTALAVLSVPPIIAVDAADTAKAMLKDTKGQDVGSVSFLQTSAGVLLQLSLNGVPAGEHAFHIHAVGKCEPPGFDSAGGHFNRANTHHGMMSGPGHAGDMPNLHVAVSGALDLEVLNASITLDKDKPNSIFHPGGVSERQLDRQQFAIAVCGEINHRARYPVGILVAKSRERTRVRPLIAVITSPASRMSGGAAWLGLLPVEGLVDFA
jgi:superoxide dismutase, Cu-Zn family